MNVPAFLAKRFLFGSRRGLPKTVSLLPLFGVALGAASLVGAVPGLAKSFADVEAKGETPVLLGAGLAKRLGASAGGAIVLETSSAALAAGLAVPARTPLAVAAVVETGFSEVDDGWA